MSQAQMRKNVVSLQKIGASGRPLLLSNVTLLKKLNICHIPLQRSQICPITKPIATGSYELRLESQLNIRYPPSIAIEANAPLTATCSVFTQGSNQRQPYSPSRRREGVRGWVCAMVRWPTPLRLSSPGAGPGSLSLAAPRQAGGEAKAVGPPPILCHHASAKRICADAPPILFPFQCRISSDLSLSMDLPALRLPPPIALTVTGLSRHRRIRRRVAVTLAARRGCLDGTPRWRLPRKPSENRYLQRCELARCDPAARLVARRWATHRPEAALPRRHHPLAIDRNRWRS